MVWIQHFSVDPFLLLRRFQEGGLLLGVGHAPSVVEWKLQ